ncbi:hypothetical protein [Photobacterium leiognathi]|uniref:hypothetical protein n=1 Tax=Photobacterium leiognathi TaxID=553611 RepID=UPI00298298A5|nr:hypothetical protein [Photobacterium leiognathi]
MDYYVLASLAEDINSGWCWVKGSDVSNRSLIQIKNNANGKSIVCEALSVDRNFEEKYRNAISSKMNKHLLDRSNVILMNAWYREKLGIVKTQSNHNLQISFVTKWCICKRIKACTMHPQVAVRLSTWLGLIGIFVGTVSLIPSQPHKLMAVTAIGYFMGRLNITRAWSK